MGEMHPSNGLFNKLANFNSFVGLLVVGFENEIIPHKEDGYKERAWHQSIRKDGKAKCFFLFREGDS